ncbi:PREDICTED: adhesion G protein-coupled receptor L3-like [Nanorana parkeri]|uniref:adhesion G protein-coupled receptor L3-like n=1 Tax=Nanorana parkeri TaxID=125878 RepID=UPI0008541E76|nr:PREDICTED: adhesion G protein-coupled receptor L3-like [Nanorana parkeri]
MRAGAEWKTAFRTHYGLFEYMVMPFGLSNATARFQCFDNNIFRDLLDIWVVIYLDDILIYSDSSQKHQKHVRWVLSRLRAHRLYAKLEKFTFENTTIPFLGYIISPEGIRMDNTKIDCILNCSKLRFTWTSEAQNAFDDLKRRFTSAPILQLPNPTYQYILETNKTLSSRQVRWSFFFDRFDYVITYRPGSKNGKADSLSRIGDTSREDTVPTSIIPPERVLAATIDLKQQLKTDLQAKHNHPQGLDQDGEGFLYYGTRLCIPPNMHVQILKRLHNSPATGHPGINRTLELVRRYFWWPKMQETLKSLETAANIARELSEHTRGHLNAGDITYSVRAMDQLVDLLDVQLRNLTPGGKDSAARSLNKLQKRERSCRAYVQAMVETVNNLLQPQAQNAWQDLTAKDQLRAATMLLDTVEEGAFVLADNLLKTDIVRENTDNIQLEVARLSTDVNLEDLKFPQNMAHSSSIQLSSNTLRQNGRNGEIRVAFVLYNNLGRYLSTENASIKLEMEALTTNHTVVVNSPVITAAVYKESSSKVYLTDPVMFTVKHIEQSDDYFNPNCSFWSYSKTNFSGHWSTQGCRLMTTNKTHTKCSCNHLTNFAVLMAHVAVKQYDVVHDLLLDVITWVGILLSLVCLLICIFTFCFFRGLQSDRNTIHKNLCISLFVAELLFLIGINRTDQPIACAVFAALLHFFFLAAFTWMFLEGVQLYIMLVEVFESENSKRKYFYLMGYGMPALIVSVSAAVDYKSYGTDKVCWLRHDTYFIWSFIGPATLIIMVSFVFFYLFFSSKPFNPLL